MWHRHTFKCLVATWRSEVILICSDLEPGEDVIYSVCRNILNACVHDRLQQLNSTSLRPAANLLYILVFAVYTSLNSAARAQALLAVTTI